MPSIPYCLPLNPIPITPIIPSDFDKRTASMCKKQSSLEVDPVSSYNWALPYTVGLPTPPNDMNGVAYNAALLDVDSRGKSNGISLLDSNVDVSNNNSSNGNVVGPVSSTSALSSSYSCQSKPASSGSKQIDSKKTPNNRIPSFLEIPSSISGAKGNLAEFAAQVRRERICIWKAFVLMKLARV